MENEMYKMTELQKCGIEILDAQHEQLYTAIKEARIHQHTVGQSQALIQLVMATVEYARVHLETEEALMVAHDYSDYKNHKHTHDDFRLSLKLAVDSVEKTGIVPEKFLKFLEMWLVCHIEVEAELFNMMLTPKVNGVTIE